MAPLGEWWHRIILAQYALSVADERCKHVAEAVGGGLDGTSQVPIMWMCDVAKGQRRLNWQQCFSGALIRCTLGQCDVLS